MEEAGASPSALSREFHVSRQSLSKLKSQLRRRDLRSDRPSQYDFEMAKQDLRRKAYPAVAAGLDCPKDPYKRGNLGVQVLKGTGDLFGDTNVNVGIQLNQCPPELLERLLLAPSDEPIELKRIGDHLLIATPAD